MYLGIDLGTTFSVGAYVDESGTPHVIDNSEGEKTTPSVVYYEGPNSVIVGQVAKDNSELYPKNVVSLVKNSMGKKETYETDYGTVTPEVVSSEILKKIVRDANKALGGRENIKDVVVTIPAYFSDPQRTATKDAIRIAGLNCLGLVNEPTAAAYYYASKVKMAKATILIYDLGGGTFDATVIHVEGTDIRVLATKGLPMVGGSFFDKDIAKYVVDEIKTKYGLDMMQPEYVDEYQELLGKAEKAKIQLSNSLRTTIPVKVDKIKATVEITRDTFEKMITKLYQRTEGVLKVAIKEAGLEIKDIDKVIMVGGSSRIPYIEEHLKALFGMQPSHEVNPDEVVAMGAALYARNLKGGKDTSRIVDVCSHGIGITALSKDGSEEYNDILIRRNTSLPAEAHKLYELGRDDQREIEITVNEGDFKELTDVSEICTVPVALPAKLKKGARIDIRIGLDRDQLLHIYLRLPNDGNVEREVTFDRKANMSEAQIGEWKKSVAGTRDGLGGSEPANTQDKSHDSDNTASESGKTGRGGLFGLVDRIRGAVDPKAVEKSETEAKAKKEPTEKFPKIIETSMEGLVGFMSVKTALRDYYVRVEASKKRALAGAKDKINRNFIIFFLPSLQL